MRSVLLRLGAAAIAAAGMFALAPAAPAAASEYRGIFMLRNINGKCLDSSNYSAYANPCDANNVWMRWRLYYEGTRSVMGKDQPVYKFVHQKSLELGQGYKCLDGHLGRVYTSACSTNELQFWNFPSNRGLYHPRDERYLMQTGVAGLELWGWRDPMPSTYRWEIVRV